MQVLVNSDHTIHGAEPMTARVESIVADAVDRFADRITRVEVHLNDVARLRRSSPMLHGVAAGCTRSKSLRMTIGR